MGILPAALFNFLMLLGWSPGGDRELITREEAQRIFDLSDVNKSPAVFDPEKLLWMNGQYLMRLTAEEIYPHLAPFLGQAPPLASIRDAIELNKGRGRTLRELAANLQPFLTSSVEYEPDAVKKHAKDSEVAVRMRELREVLSAAEPFDVATTERVLRELAERRGVSAAKYIHPLRLALTGRGASPPIFDVAAVLGRDRALQRLDRFIERLPELMPA